MPGHKPAARRKKGAGEAKKPRRKRPHDFARLRMEPTAQVTDAPASCPECHTTLSGGWVQRTREVIELPVCPAEVTEHVFIARRCPLCRKRRLPQAAAGRCRGPAAAWGQSGQSDHHSAGRGAVAGKDNPMVSANGPPVETERWAHRPDHPLGSPTGRTGRPGPVVNEVLERIRRSPVVHADETGWRENGVNGCVWTFSTPAERRFLRRAGAGKWWTRRWERPLAGYW